MEKQLALLVEKNNALIQKMEERDAVYAQILQKKQKAEIPDDELKKIRDTVENAKCGLPDTSDVENKITDGVTSSVRSTLINEVREAVRREYIPSERVEDLKDKLIIYRVVCAMLVIIILGVALIYRNSEQYWGSQYVKVAESKYLTSEEKKILWNDIYAIEALPKEFESNPAYVKAKIKQNVSVLKERKKEAKANNGKWSPRVPIER